MMSLHAILQTELLIKVKNMLNKEREALSVGQQIFYRDYRLSVKTPKVVATVVSKKKYSTEIKYTRESTIKFPPEHAGKVNRFESIAEAISSSLFFTNDDSDWYDYRGYTLSLHPFGEVYSVKIFVGNYEAMNLCDFNRENPHSYSLEDVKKYIDLTLFKAPSPLPLQQEIITGCNWWAENLMSFAAKMPDDGFERSPDETFLTLSLLHNVPQPKVENIRDFAQKLLKALNQAVIFLKNPHFILAVDNIGDLCPLLSDAADGLIDEYLFPAKTVMRIGEGYVEVSMGYGADFEKLPLCQVTNIVPTDHNFRFDMER
ncbi:MAG: hypothetical protein HWQ38_24305 [Nostoc sp. NMS7]|uniref:hypothetical protein n=1 Tax=Nostoc sp. NMS7 TaxID=2815391 RepID=UPI0025DD4E4D|nr:hypothetical protein [Nostoc sp. NMS7]MBN3949417.1 hypothetical protein [Nostoc sp. NMS7]